MTRVHEVCLARGGNTSRVGFLAGDKKEWSGAHSCHQRSLPSIQAHSLPSACSVEFCLLCCQPEPSLNLCLPGWHRLLYANLAVCKLKGGELSTWRAGLGDSSCPPPPKLQRWQDDRIPAKELKTTAVRTSNFFLAEDGFAEATELCKKLWLHPSCILAFLSCSKHFATMVSFGCRATHTRFWS